MNNKRLISLTVCLILATVPGISSLILADIASETDTKAQQHFEKANELRKLADYDAAIAEYNKVISLSPKSKIAQDAQYWVGQSYFGAGQFDAALSAFQKLLDEYPASAIIPSTKLMIERIQQAKKIKSLFEAARKGDIEQVKSLISKGVDINVTDDKGRTPLHYAAEHSHREVSELLIAEGADVNASGPGDWTALFYAILNDDVDMVRLLVDKGADCNVHDNRGSTLLTWAITALGEKDKEIVELLISRGASINLEDKKGGRTPLYWAAFHGSKGVFEVLLAKVTDSNTIHLAALKGELARVKTFMQGGTDVNTKDRFSCTALHWAVLANTNDVADFLIAKGSDVRAKDNNGFTPLLGARRLDMIGFLISKGADVNAKDDTFGYTKLHMACLRKDRNMAAFLISKGADVNTKNNWGWMPLHNAIGNGHREIVELLTANGADVNMGNWIGTPLHLAVRGGHRDIAELLIAKGADVNAKNKSGRTALDIAVDQGHTEIVELLRKHGAKE